MLTSDVGIVLRTIKYGESSNIAHVFTQEHGVIAIIVKGARKKKSRHSYLQPLSIVLVEYYRKPSKDLYLCKQISQEEPFLTAHTDLLKQSVMMFLNELIYKTLKEETGDPHLFKFLYKFLVAFDHQDFNPNSHVWFLCHYSKFMGIFPDISSYSPNYCFNIQEGCFEPSTQKPNVVNARLSGVLYSLLGMKFVALGELKISKDERKTLVRELLDYYATQMDGMKRVNSHMILEEVLSE